MFTSVSPDKAKGINPLSSLSITYTELPALLRTVLIQLAQYHLDPRTAHTSVVLSMQLNVPKAFNLIPG